MPTLHAPQTRAAQSFARRDLSAQELQLARLRRALSLSVHMEGGNGATLLWMDALRAPGFESDMAQELSHQLLQTPMVVAGRTLKPIAAGYRQTSNATGHR